MNTKISLILVALIIVLIALCYYFSDQWIKEKQLRVEKENIISTKEQLIINEKGQNASITKVWVEKYSDLENSYKKERSLRSDVEQKNAEAYEIIEMYKKREKSLISYYSSTITAVDTFIQQMPADCQLKPIKSKHFNIDYIYKDTLVKTICRYSANQSHLITLMPKKKLNGKNHFPNWGNLPWVGWEAIGIATIDDSLATITNQYVVKFKK